MLFEYGGRKYELLFGTDVTNDTTYLELNDITDGEPEVVLFGEKTTAGECRFLSAANLALPRNPPLLLPLELVEDFITRLKNL